MSDASVVAAATGSQQARAAANNPRGVSALLYACQQGDVDKVRRILRAQPGAYLERDRTGKSALHYCCTSDRISAAQAADVLVMAAPDLVESRDEDGFTPLHLAVIAGNMPLVTFLLANNADVNAVDNEKHTVVHWATVCGETVALRAVLAAGAPVSTPDVHGGYPLHYAAQMCGGEKDSSLGLQVLYTLLSHEDISVSVEDGDGRPPLLWAASAGSAKAVLALIRAGSAVESHDKDGLTALHCAASRGHTDCIDTLLTLCGASPDVIDSNGCTALHYAVTLGHADATALLLAHAADPNRQDRKGRTSAHCGCAKGQFETVKMLGAHGANLWLRNARGDLPLHEAAASGRRDLVRWLLEARPSQVNARNNDGRCPLHLAALNDNADMCKILLDAGAQINPVLRTSKNAFMTPLDCALQRGFRATAKYLQLHGGVPANRLAGNPQGPAVGSAVSLHIRDDVTLWGDTSSETEKEETGKPTKSKKKTYKRKLAYKYEKKKLPVSASEYDSGKVSAEKAGSGETTKPQGAGKGQGSKLEGKEGYHTDFPFLTGSNIPPGEIFIYANEVNINDKFGGVRIQQNGEFMVTEPTKLPEAVEHSIPVPQPPSKNLKSSAGSTGEKQDKRPRSAKYGRLKNKSAGSNDKTDSATKKIHTDTPDPRRKQDNETISAYKNGHPEEPVLDESEKIDSKIATVDNSVKKQASTVKVAKSPKATAVAESPTTKEAGKISHKSQRSEKPRIMQSDQQSARSNTSYEDGEDHQELIVEASVHLPPKERAEKDSPSKEVLEGSELTTAKESLHSRDIADGISSPKDNLEVSALPDEKRRTPIGSELLDESNVNHITTDKRTDAEDMEQTAEVIKVAETTPTATVAIASKKDLPQPIEKTTPTAVEAAPIIETAASAAETTVLVAEPTTIITQSGQEKATDAIKKETEEVEIEKVGADATYGVGVTPTDTTVETDIAVSQKPAAVDATETTNAASTVSTKTVAADTIVNNTVDVAAAAAAAADIVTAASHVAAAAAVVATNGAAATTLTTSEGDFKHAKEENSAAKGAVAGKETESESKDPGNKPSSVGDANTKPADIQPAAAVFESKSIEISSTADANSKSADAQPPAAAEQKLKEEYSGQLQPAHEELKRAKNEVISVIDHTTAAITKDVKSHKEEHVKGIVESETSSDMLSPTGIHNREVTDEQVMVAETGKRQKSKSDYKKRRKASESPEKRKDVSKKSHKSTEGHAVQSSTSVKKHKSPPDSSIDAKSSEESGEETPPSTSSQSSVAEKEHRSFKVLDDTECAQHPEMQRDKQRRSFRKRSPTKKPRAQSEEVRSVKLSHQGNYKEHERLRRSKIPTPVNIKTPLSKSDKHLDRHDRKSYSGVQARVPSLPNIHDSSLKHSRSASNLSAPVASTYSDNDHETGSDGEEVSSATRKKRLRKRSKSRGAKSAGSDYESSNLIDSGFEPSPRSSRIPKWKNMTERGVNMTSVTQTIQNNIRRYHLERKIFQHLLDLKKLQIRSGQHNEAVLVKRAIDSYHRSCTATVGAGRYISQDYSFKSFEHFLYNSLRKIQRNGSEHLYGLPEAPKNPLFCTQSTHRCDHATHAYTGVPCAAYLPKMDHHTIPKIGFECKPGSFLPKIASKNTVTLELCHGSDKQVISLPAERLDQNKRYYVTFTVKGNDGAPGVNEVNAKVSSASHVHSKSD